jgi:pimeloyl-ACP methyl ester carboxylesterase
MSYGAMAQDTIAFLEAVGTGPAHLVGWSDGAIVALLVALKRPDLVRRLVLLSGALDTSGWVPQFEPATRLPADSPLFEPFRVAYEAASPDGPDHWPVVFAKVMEMWRAEPHIPRADLAQLQARTLILVGDDDLATLEHATEMYRTLPDGELAVVPGASHFALMEKPDLVNHIIVDFLTQDRIPTLMPVRRAVSGAE